MFFSDNDVHKRFIWAPRMCAPKGRFNDVQIAQEWSLPHWYYIWRKLIEYYFFQLQEMPSTLGFVAKFSF